MAIKKEEKLDKIVRMYHQNLSLGNYIVVEPQGQDMVDLNSSTIFNRSLSTMLQNKKIIEPLVQLHMQVVQSTINKIN